MDLVRGPSIKDMSISQHVAVPCRQSHNPPDVLIDKVLSVKHIDMASKASWQTTNAMAVFTVVVVVVASILSSLFSFGTSSTVSPAMLIFWLVVVPTLHQIFWNVFIYPKYSRFAHIPAAPQEPLSKRFLKEPNARDFERWINEIPNDGLIRYYGSFNAERFLMTTPEGMKELVQTHANDTIKAGLGIKLLDKILPYGLVTVNEPNEHRVNTLGKI